MHVNMHCVCVCVDVVVVADAVFVVAISSNNVRRRISDTRTISRRHNIGSVRIRTQIRNITLFPKLLSIATIVVSLLLLLLLCI